MSHQAPECDQRWASMDGDDRCRRCGKCGLFLHRLAELSSRESAELLELSKAEPVGEATCRRADGAVRTKAAPAYWVEPAVAAPPAVVEPSPPAAAPTVALPVKRASPVRAVLLAFLGVIALGVVLLLKWDAAAQRAFEKQVTEKAYELVATCEQPDRAESAELVVSVSPNGVVSSACPTPEREVGPWVNCLVGQLNRTQLAPQFRERVSFPIIVVSPPTKEVVVPETPYRVHVTSMRETSVEGSRGVDAHSLAQSLNDNSNAFLACFHAYPEEPLVHAELIVIEWVMSSSGEVTSARIRSAVQAREHVDACLLTALKATKFAPIRWPQATIAYPFQFIPEDAP